MIRGPVKDARNEAFRCSRRQGSGIGCSRGLPPRCRKPATTDCPARKTQHRDPPGVHIWVLEGPNRRRFEPAAAPRCVTVMNWSSIRAKCPVRPEWREDLDSASNRVALVLPLGLAIVATRLNTSADWISLGSGEIQVSEQVQSIMRAVQSLDDQQRRELMSALATLEPVNPPVAWARQQLVDSIRGKYRHVPTSSESFLRRK